MRPEQFVDAIARKVERDDEERQFRRMEVSGRSGGLIVLREPVTGEVIDQPFAGIAGWKYDTDDEVMTVHLGGGEYFVIGPVMRGPLALIPFDASYIGETFHHQRDASNGETTSTTNTATFVAARTLDWSGLPDGTYTIHISGDVLMSHSAGGQVSLQCAMTLNGAGDAAVNGVTVPTGNPAARVAAESIFTGFVVSGGAGIAPVLQYKGDTAGTTSVKNPIIRGWAKRTA